MISINRLVSSSLEFHAPTHISHLEIVFQWLDSHLIDSIFIRNPSNELHWDEPVGKPADLLLIDKDFFDNSKSDLFRIDFISDRICRLDKDEAFHA